MEYTIHYFDITIEKVHFNHKLLIVDQILLDYAMRKVTMVMQIECSRFSYRTISLASIRKTHPIKIVFHAGAHSNLLALARPSFQAKHNVHNAKYVAQMMFAH